MFVRLCEVFIRSTLTFGRDHSLPYLLSLCRSDPNNNASDDHYIDYNYSSVKSFIMLDREYLKVTIIWPKSVPFIDILTSQLRSSPGLTSGFWRQWVTFPDMAQLVAPVISVHAVGLSNQYCLLYYPTILSDSLSITCIFSQSIRWFWLDTSSVISDLMEMLVGLVFASLVNVPLMSSTSFVL